MIKDNLNFQQINKPVKPLFISNGMKKNKKNNGYILVFTLIIINSLALLLYYYVDLVFSENVISKSQILSVKDYYIAEAGTHDAIWHIKNDPSLLSSFQTDPNWSTTTQRLNPFGPNTSYQYTINNNDLGKAWVYTTSTEQLKDSSGQRVIKAKIFQTLNPVAPEGVFLYSASAMDFWQTTLILLSSNLFSNDTISFHPGSFVIAFSDISAHTSISQVNSMIIAPHLYAPTGTISMPQVDFDSVLPTSYHNRAAAQGHVYTQAQWNTLYNNNPNLTLNGINYVEGSLSLGNGHNLTVNGLLVVDGSVSIGTTNSPGNKPHPNFYINSVEGQPSGLLTKSSISVGQKASQIYIEGLLYSIGPIDIQTHDNVPFLVLGGIICGSINAHQLGVIDLNYDPELINGAINVGSTPIMNVEHWEEEY
jgi:hypothetical protein